MSTAPLIKADKLVAGYASKAVAGPLNLELYAGQFICLLGPNGSGKSTLLRTLAGLQPALSGGLLLTGKHIARLKPAGIAKIISIVLTDAVRSGNMDVYSLIALGRYPYTGWFGTPGEPDKKIVQEAITAAHVEEFLEKKYSQLSDGQAQKVMLARALAQDTPLIMLDEPTAHVDLPGRIQLMQLLHRLCRESNKAILISTHELDLALQVADQVWLLDAVGQLQTGTPEDLVLNGVFEAAFNKEGISFDKATGSFPVHSSYNKAAVQLTGEGINIMWTKRALQRTGYRVMTEPGTSAHVIRVFDDTGKVYWMYEHDGKSNRYDTIEELLHALKIFATGS